MSVRNAVAATTTVVALLVLAGCSSSEPTGAATSQATPSASAGQVSPAAVSGHDDTARGVSSAYASTQSDSTAATAVSVARPVAPAETGTVSQGDALAKAEQYLAYTAFSRPGLIKQLVFEGFSQADATYAADHVAVDWNAQAAKKAADYVSYSSFSHSGLVKQLRFEGFTAEQAAHGVASVGR